MASRISLLDIEFDRRTTDDTPVGRALDYAKLLVVGSFHYWQKDGLVAGKDGRGDPSGFAVLMKVVSRLEDVTFRKNFDDIRVLFDQSHTDFDPSLRRRFARRALCKLRATVRTGRDTVDLARDDFQDVVTDKNLDDTSAYFGEYPRAGAIRVEVGEFVAYVAVDGFSDKQNHECALFVGRMTLLKLDELCAAEAAKR